LTQLLGFERSGPREASANSSAEHSRLSWTVTRELSDSERDDLLDHIESLILSGEFKVSGPHRKPDWEAGWGENLANLASAESSDVEFELLPKYFGKSNFVRIGGVHVSSPSSDKLESELLSVLVDSLVLFVKQTYLAESVYEFGCGTGHHLVRLRRIMPEAKLVGLDWAESSQKILAQISRNLKDPALVGENFDFFSPNTNLVVNDRSIFLTVASLEQVGHSFGPFLDFVLKAKPSVVVHVEPIEELLGVSREEELSKVYFKKRGYLTGYLSALLELEAKGQLRIVAAERTGLGSLFIEGYSVIVWEPIFV
jgi:SAM-dependent methyltransferase